MPQIPESVHRVARHVVAWPGRVVPYAVQAPVLQSALNRAFRIPLENGELDFLAGRRIRVRVTDARLNWLLEAAADGFTAVDPALPEDVSISGELPDFALLATRRADHDTLFFQRRIRIEGDTELGLGLKNTIDSMDWDDLPPPLRAFLQGLGRVIGALSDAGVAPLRPQGVPSNRP
ncbi:MAG: SCP2 sterol-binding domain-containing protein [Xanthomonadales bacterium]